VAANRLIGRETAISLGLKVVQEGVISLTELFEKMSTNPARILGLGSGLRPDRSADITIIDSDLAFKVDIQHFQSLSRNCPFDGWQLQGKAVLTMVDGRIVFEEKNPNK